MNGFALARKECFRDMCDQRGIRSRVKSVEGSGGGNVTGEGSLRGRGPSPPLRGHVTGHGRFP